MLSLMALGCGEGPKSTDLSTSEGDVSQMIRPLF